MVRDGEGQLNRLGRAIDRVGRMGQRAGTMIASGLRRGATAGFTALTAIARRGMSTVGNILRRGLLIGSAGVAAGAGYLLWQLTGGMIETTSQFEQFQVVLENTEGSAARARRAMAWVRNFAQTTPYEVGDVMAAFVSLRAYGIDPTQGALRSLGNAASGMNKSLSDAVEMLADAQTGEFERLKEFGIRARVTGNQVRLSYMRDGREMSKSVRNSAAEIQRAITGIFDERFGGMMDRQSRTMAGLWSNLKDQWTSFTLAVGQAGIFDLVKTKVQSLLDTVNRMAANGQLQAWAQRVSRFLESAFTGAWNFFTQTDWAAVGARVKAVGDALWICARAVQVIAQFGEGIFNFFTGRGRHIDSVPDGSFRQGLIRRSFGGTMLERAVPTARAEWYRRQLGGPQNTGRGARMFQNDNGPPAARGWRPGITLRPTMGSGRFNLFGPAAPPMRQQGGAARPQEVRVRNEIGGRVAMQFDLSPNLLGRITRLESANNDVPLSVSRGIIGVLGAM